MDKIKKGFKQTEVGVIPEDWRNEATVNIVDSGAPICYGVVQVGQNDDKGIPIVAIKFVKDIVHAPLHHTSVNIENLYTRSRVKGGDVLISIKGTIGRVGIVPDGFTGNISRELARLRLNKNFSPIYLAHQLESELTQKRISNYVVGTTRLEFSISTLRQFKIPIPPTLAEQTAIANALSDTDELIQSIEKLIEKKRAIKQGAMQELLTGKRRLPGFGRKPVVGVEHCSTPTGESAPTTGYKQTEVGMIPKDWVVAAIDNIADITTGSRNTQDKIDSGQYPFFVRSQIVEKIDSFSFEGEAILTAGDGVGTGKVFHYVNGKFDYHQRVYKISGFIENVNGYYFYLYFKSNFYNRIMQMTAKSSVDSVRREMISKMKIPLPPTLAEQTAIAEVLSNMDAEIDELETRLEKYKKIKQGMMQELLTGRIRLIPVVGVAPVGAEHCSAPTGNSKSTDK